MKRFLSIFLAVVLIATMSITMVSCGDGTDETETGDSGIIDSLILKGKVTALASKVDDITTQYGKEILEKALAEIFEAIPSIEESNNETELPSIDELEPTVATDDDAGVIEGDNTQTPDDSEENEVPESSETEAVVPDGANTPDEPENVEEDTNSNNEETTVPDTGNDTTTETETTSPSTDNNETDVNTPDSSVDTDVNDDIQTPEADESADVPDETESPADGENTEGNESTNPTEPEDTETDDATDGDESDVVDPETGDNTETDEDTTVDTETDVETDIPDDSETETDPPVVELTLKEKVCLITNNDDYLYIKGVIESILIIETYDVDTEVMCFKAIERITVKEYFGIFVTIVESAIANEKLLPDYTEYIWDEQTFNIGILADFAANRVVKVKTSENIKSINDFLAALAEGSEGTEV